MSSTTTPLFRCSTIFSKLESLHLPNSTSLTEGCEPSGLFSVASPGSTTLSRSEKSPNKRTQTRAKHVLAALAAATSSLLRRRRSPALQSDYQTTLNNPSTSTVSSCGYAKPQFTQVQLHTSNMSLISLEEAAKRPELTKELYLVDKLHARNYSTTQVKKRFPHATLISLEEAAARPELTKRILFQ